MIHWLTAFLQSIRMQNTSASRKNGHNTCLYFFMGNIIIPMCNAVMTMSNARPGILKLMWVPHGAFLIAIEPDRDRISRL